MNEKLQATAKLDPLVLEPDVRRLAEEKLEIMRQMKLLRDREAKINKELLALESPAARWVVSCW